MCSPDDDGLKRPKQRAFYLIYIVVIKVSRAFFDCLFSVSVFQHMVRILILY